MPRTRSASSHEAKREEILDAAESRLVAGGYSGLSVVALARELGVAQNTVHWYYPTKDDLFVAVLRRRIDRTVADKPPTRAGWVAQVIWFVDQLAQHRALIVTMRDRASISAAVAVFQREFDDNLRRIAGIVLRPRLPAADVDTATTALLCLVDGLLIQHAGTRDRHRTLRYFLTLLSNSP